MRFKGSIRKSDYLVAIGIGSITGLVGFGLFLTLLFLSSNQPIQEPNKVETSGSTIKGEEVEFFASQFGVFSTFEGAQQLITMNTHLNNASIVRLNEKYYVWLSLELAPTEIPESSQMYWKTIKISNVCQQYPELIQDYEKIYENYNLQKNDMLAKLPSEWHKEFLQIVDTISVGGVWRAKLLEQDMESSKCLKVNLD